MNVNNSAIQVTTSEIYSKPSNLTVRDEKFHDNMVAKSETKPERLRDIYKLKTPDKTRDHTPSFVRSTYLRSSLGNLTYDGLEYEEDYDLLSKNQSLSLEKIEKKSNSRERPVFKFPSCSFIKLNINCPLDLSYYGINLVPFFNEKNECTGISVVSDSNKSDISLYENRRQENCPLQVSDKITSYNSVFLNDENLKYNEFLNGLLRVLNSSEIVELALSRRSNSLTKMTIPNTTTSNGEERLSRSHKKFTLPLIKDSQNDCTNGQSVTQPSSLTLKTDFDMDPIERIEFLDRSWLSPGVENRSNSQIPLYSSTNSHRRNPDGLVSPSNVIFNPLRPSHFGSSSIRKLKNRSEGKTFGYLNGNNSQSSFELNSPSSLRGSKKSIKDVNSFNTRAIGETIEVNLIKDHVNGFGFRLVSRESLIDGEEPVFVNQITLNGPADLDKTLKIGDRIIKLDNYNVKNFQECIDRLKAKGPNDSVTLVISRHKDDDENSENANENSQDFNNNNDTSSSLNNGKTTPKHSDTRKNYIQVRFLVEYKEPKDLTKQLGISLNWFDNKDEAEKFEQIQFIQSGFYITKVVPNSLICSSNDSSDCELKPGDLLSIINNISLANLKTQKETLTKITQLIEETHTIFKENIRTSFISNNAEIDPVVLFLTFKRPKMYNQNDRKGSSRSISSPPISKRIRDRDYVSRSEMNSPLDEVLNQNAFVRDGPGRKSMSSKRPIGMTKEEIQNIRNNLYDHMMTEDQYRAYRTMPNISRSRQLRGYRRTPLDLKLSNGYLTPKDQITRRSSDIEPIREIDEKSEVKIETDVPPPLPLRIRSPEPKMPQTPIPSTPTSQYTNNGPQLPVRNKSPNPYSSPIRIKGVIPETRNSSKSKPRSSIFDFVKQMKNSFSFHSVNNHSNSTAINGNPEQKKSHSKRTHLQRHSKSPNPSKNIIPTSPQARIHPNDYEYLNPNALMKESISLPKNISSVYHKSQKDNQLHLQEIYNPQSYRRPLRLNSYHTSHQFNDSNKDYVDNQFRSYEEPIRPSLPNRRNLLTHSDNYNHTVSSPNHRRNRRGSDSKNQYILKTINSQNGHEVKYLSLMKKETMKKAPLTEQRKKSSRAII